MNPLDEILEILEKLRNGNWSDAQDMFCASFMSANEFSNVLDTLTLEYSLSVSELSDLTLLGFYSRK